ncbi:hypothetical protein GALL_268040 [mine drainage metagenome]|uniref:Uncharacterized protein n=1 Tax=mine drainage metagenome TaxID=410659 RepID=A0A1J5RGZ7_9ZZZZ
MRRIMGRALIALAGCLMAAGCAAPPAPDTAAQGDKVLRVEVKARPGVRTRLGSYVRVNADCSPDPAGPRLRILEAPHDGTVRITTENLITRFPEGNPRAKCDGRVYANTVLSYMPRDEFEGGDQILVEVANGDQAPVHVGYVIVVGQWPVADSPAESSLGGAP